jgi:hypothetical protein
MFDKLNVSEGVLSNTKDPEAKKLPPKNPSKDHHTIDYLKER